MAAPRSGTDGSGTLGVAGTEGATPVGLSGNDGLTGGPTADDLFGGAGNGTPAGGGAVHIRATSLPKGRRGGGREEFPVSGQ